MMALARVITDYPHRVQRDLLCHRFRWADFGRPDAEPLSFPHFISFVFGAEPTSALGQAVNEGWTPADHLLANLAEQQAGLIGLTSRYPRPGVSDKPSEPEIEAVEQHRSAEQLTYAVASGASFDTFQTPADFEAKRREFMERQAS